MDNYTVVSILEKNGIKPTSNRILVLKALLDSRKPLSLKDIEADLVTMEKSSVFRVLALLAEQHVLHTIEDGSGVTRYEICKANEDCCLEEEIHAHFYCELCHEVFCFDSIHLPKVDFPDGFSVRSMNYMFKGVCPKCNSKQ
ncbi:Fur family transcriptional regulator [uncultured Muribaculum sp.]|uniref:Fur family transcriptional regulator n=1 Tax=uncultured Muribaculum sp. TaxID=1918613 RepID=UPI0026703E42|nr:Fur family transcriptional regulator [uncultured Muribaculum sp.]